MGWFGLEETRTWPEWLWVEDCRVATWGLVVWDGAA